MREGVEGDGGDEEEGQEVGGGEEGKALRLLIGTKVLRRRKLRRMVITQLLRERAA